MLSLLMGRKRDIRLSIMILLFVQQVVIIQEIQGETLQIPIQQSRDDTHFGMIMKRYSRKRRKDKDSHRVLFWHFGNVNISDKGHSFWTFVTGVDIVVDGADINSVCRSSIVVFVWDSCGQGGNKRQSMSQGSKRIPSGRCTDQVQRKHTRKKVPSSLLLDFIIVRTHRTNAHHFRLDANAAVRRHRAVATTA